MPARPTDSAGPSTGSDCGIDRISFRPEPLVGPLRYSGRPVGLEGSALHEPRNSWVGRPCLEPARYTISLELRDGTAEMLDQRCLREVHLVLDVGGWIGEILPSENEVLGTYVSDLSAAVMRDPTGKHDAKAGYERSPGNRRNHWLTRILIEHLFH